MTLESYIARHLTVQGQPTFEWSDWKCRDYYMWDRPEGYLADMSDAAALALLLGTGRWIRDRFAAIEPDPMPRLIHDAGWAYMLEPDACVYYEPDDDPWRGPVRAPLAVMAVIEMDSLFCRGEDPEVRVRTFWMANLARHVLEADVPVFEAWFNHTAQRLTQVHPRSEMPKLGLFDIPERFEPVVGRDVLDPDSPYVPAEARAALLTYLFAGARDNPFIAYAALQA
jgi:hypothetical protein